MPCSFHVGTSAYGAGKPLVRRHADDAKLAGFDLVRDIAGRGRHEVDVAAQQRGDRLRRAFERDNLQRAHVAADRFREQTRRDMIVAAERRGKTDADRFRILLQALGEVAAGFDCRIGFDREYDVSLNSEATGVKSV